MRILAARHSPHISTTSIFTLFAPTAHVGSNAETLKHNMGAQIVQVLKTEGGLETLEWNMHNRTSKHPRGCVCMEPRHVTGGLPDGRSALALPEGTEGPKDDELWGPNAPHTAQVSCIIHNACLAYQLHVLLKYLYIHVTAEPRCEDRSTSGWQSVGRQRSFFAAGFQMRAGAKAITVQFNLPSGDGHWK